LNDIHNQTSIEVKNRQYMRFNTREHLKYLPGANVTQVLEENSFCSRSIYVNKAAVPPPSE